MLFPVVQCFLQTGLEGKLIWLDQRTSVSSWWYRLPLAANPVSYVSTPCVGAAVPCLSPFCQCSHLVITHICYGWQKIISCLQKNAGKLPETGSGLNLVFLPLMVLFSSTFWANPRQVVNLLDSLHQTENMVYKGISVGVSKILFILDFQNSAAHNPPLPLFNFIKCWQAMLFKSHWLLLNKPTEWAGAQSIMVSWWVTHKLWCGGWLGRKWSLVKICRSNLCSAEKPRKGSIMSMTFHHLVSNQGDLLMHEPVCIWNTVTLSWLV